MISLIVCSRNKDISEILKSNIAGTIGIEFELIVLDNSKNEYSIFSAYKEGVSRAKYPYLCFMHEDVIYHTKDWGEKVVKHLQNEEIGLIGVAGGHYLPDCPASWWSTFCISEEYLQGYRTSTGEYSLLHNSKRRVISGENKTSVSAVAVDGFWFCIPKRLFKIIHFDDKYYTGWHAYDLDICLQVLDANFQVRVIFDILLEHSSFGNGNQEWLFGLEKFYKKWEKKLPLIKGIELSDYELADRKILVEENYKLKKEVFRLSSEIDRVHHSKVYCLVKIILRPFSKIKSLLFT